MFETQNRAKGQSDRLQGHIASAGHGEVTAPASAQAGAGIHTFLATHFASGVLCRHIPLDTGVQHPQQHVHAGEGLGLTDRRLPLLRG